MESGRVQGQVQVSKSWVRLRKVFPQVLGRAANGESIQDLRNTCYVFAYWRQDRVVLLRYRNWWRGVGRLQASKRRQDRRTP